MPFPLVDASTPVRWTGANTANGATFVSASFTPPNGSDIVLTVENDTTATETGQAFTLTGGSLTYVAKVERTGTETTAGGYSGIWTAHVTTGAAMTVTLTRTAGTASTGRVSIKGYVLTGVDPTTPYDTVGANNEGGSTTQALTTSSLTPGADGLLIVADTDWSQKGLMTSSDLTIDTADYATAVSVASGYKTCSSGVAVTGSLTAGAAAPQHKWCQIIARAAAAAATLDQYRWRFRNDDGSETTATWIAAENTNITVPLGSIVRPRFGVNATGDPTSQAPELDARITPAATGIPGAWKRARPVP